jgi:hypothetical protein
MSNGSEIILNLLRDRTCDNCYYGQGLFCHEDTKIFPEENTCNLWEPCKHYTGKPYTGSSQLESFESEL